MTDTKLIKDFAAILSGKGFEIANQTLILQEPPNYRTT